MFVPAPQISQSMLRQLAPTILSYSTKIYTYMPIPTSTVGAYGSAFWMTRGAIYVRCQWWLLPVAKPASALPVMSDSAPGGATATSSCGSGSSREIQSRLTLSLPRPSRGAWFYVHQPQARGDRHDHAVGLIPPSTGMPAGGVMAPASLGRGIWWREACGDASSASCLHHP